MRVPIVPLFASGALSPHMNAMDKAPRIVLDDRQVNLIANL